MNLEMKMNLLAEYGEYPYPSYNTLAQKYKLNYWQVLNVFLHPIDDLADVTEDSINRHVEGQVKIRKSVRRTRIEASKAGGYIVPKKSVEQIVESFEERAKNLLEGKEQE